MAGIVTKFAAKKMLSSQMKKYKNKDVVNDYVIGPGKFKKVKKQIPDYIPEHDAVILAKMRKRAYMLDMALFNLFGIRFGWSSVIGIIPAAGDALDGLLALLLVWRCSGVKCGLGTGILLQMLFNVAVDFFVGIIPIIGDLADAAFRANTKNVRLLEKRLDKKYKPKRKTSEDMPPATVYEEFSEGDGDEETMVLPQYHSRNEPRRPDPARSPEERRGGPAPHRSGSNRIQKHPPSRHNSSRQHGRR
ncbi:hypothetical protein BDY21DRAFT_388046 [Lineolata rhizophorae]|uniref:PH domain-containing protein n=1 Tax=Lineolata rhizophorae TaxID=578093 RepID=A0A6A6NQI1_9PEZI|nr:hypothetical protein BDY21DRAFT_388046 [Lineolata rhizophorae]